VKADSERIRVERDEQVGVLTLNRPERHNAVDDAMGEAYARAMDELIADDGVRCILVRAEGKSFCSGRDVAVLGRRERDESDFAFVRRHQEARLRQLEAPKPIVAAVRGYALGGGMEMALAADIRLCSTDAQFGLPEILYGILPDTGGTQTLTALVGGARAKYLVMTGRRIDARTALAWGVVDFVVEPEALDAEALALAKDIAAKPPIALAMAKQLIDQQDGDRIRNGIRSELLAQTALFRTDDYTEARAAQRDGRTPKYKGR
jgi:enoyl-CoA hydratase/carnithine racemase